ncbi:unnamed protein product [Rotaria sordida]|uniref:Uncharacterized protein n=1 Tax=Rotaria sordida TaxID=392033 RepID=A0A815LBZ4_9BILA|nr:unnamed protein product [Rotaria sordida]CAF1404098.1 unnamed protein product [Rotaria sordida]
MEDHLTHPWAASLPSVIFFINTRTTRTTKKASDQLVFGQGPRTNNHYWESLHGAALTDESSVDDFIVDKITPSNKSIICEQLHSAFISKNSNIQSD